MTQHLEDLDVLRSVEVHHLDEHRQHRRLRGGTQLPLQHAQTFDRLVARASVPRIRLHDLRHTYATIALRAGVHPAIVSERLGHSSIAVTIDLYSHAVPGLQREAAGVVGNLIFGAAGPSVGGRG